MGKSVIIPEDLKGITRFSIAFENVEQVNPLFSKCFIKILYSGLNQNKVFIEKDVANEMAKTLYNIPIVGEYVEKAEDFKDHGGKIEIEDNEIEFIHTTKPYGVVPFNTDVKWMEVTEKDGTTKEYLTCWGYLWTGRYPEVKRVIEQGNPQSLELDENTLEGSWIKEGPLVYFKISKAIFSALTILGEKVPPAFESASIGAYYVLNHTEFSKKFNKMMRELKESIPTEEQQVVNFSKEEEEIENNQGGENMPDEKLKVNFQFELSHEDVYSKVYEAVNPVKEDGSREWKYSVHNVYDDRAIVYDFETGKHYRQYYTKGENNISLGDKVEVVIKDVTPEEEVTLNAIKQDFETMKTNYSQLQTETEELKTTKEEYEGSKEELEQLRNFKAGVEKIEKENVITKFSVYLAEEDLKECQDNIDNLTKDEIEAKLSVVAVRKNVNFSKNEETETEEPLIPDPQNNDDTPGWVKIVADHKDK